MFLTAVLASAVAYGLLPSLFACLISVLAYNFFFLPPLYTFTIADPENVVALFFFAVVAVIVSNLAARVRAQAVAARQRANTTEDLYLFTRKLAGSAMLDDLLWATAFQIASMLKVNVVLLLPEDDTLAVRAAYPPEDTLDEADLAAAKWCWQNNQPAGRGADTLPGAKRLFLPMRTGRGPVGIVGLDSDRPGPLLTPDQRRLFNALADQAALAIERIGLAQDVEQARLAAETERLRSALLTSISHDLRTPLASVLGSATSLRELPSHARRCRAGRADRHDPGGSRAAQPLHRNLLDMTRLEAGAVAAAAPTRSISPMSSAALSAGRESAGRHRVADRSDERSADAAARPGTVRAGPVQPARQRRQIFAARHRDPPARPPRRGTPCGSQVIDEGPGHSAG